jgi:hypothetical protein
LMGMGRNLTVHVEGLIFPSAAPDVEPPRLQATKGTGRNPYFGPKVLIECTVTVIPVTVIQELTPTLLGAVSVRQIQSLYSP